MDATGLPDGWPWAGACRVPTGLSDERLIRWAERRSDRDGRLAEGRGRPVGAAAWRSRRERRRALCEISDDGQT